MSNLTFDEGLIREHTAEPLEGHVVVVLERVGETGERFHSLIEPGGTSLGPSPRGYLAFAVDASRPRTLSFTEPVGTMHGVHVFELRLSVEYYVSDPQLLVSVRRRDPLAQVRREVSEVVAREIPALPRLNPDSLRRVREKVVDRGFGRLQAVARGYGIEIADLRIKPELYVSELEGGRGVFVIEERGTGIDYGELLELRQLRRERGGNLRGEDTEGEGAGAFPKSEPPATSDGDEPAVREPTLRGAVSAGDKLYRVWYATNRQPNRDGAATGFGGRPDSRVHFGSCDVVIPASHKIGELGSPWIRRLFSGTDDRLRLREVMPMEEASFWTSVREYAATFDAKHRHALVFIHGFRVSFKDAALRAAQLGYDLNVQGPIAFFSWPSRATLLGYVNDGSAAEASERVMTEFLTRFTRDCGADRVHVIAHSMGNRLLLRAVQRIVAAAETTPAVRFGHLVLAAPDITRDLFLDVADEYRQLSQRTTLYVSDVDRALRASFRLQGPRVGLAPPITCVPGIDTVHVANVDRTLLGHSTFAEARPVLSDIRELLNYDAPPERRGLDERGEGSERYWEVRA